MKTTTKTTKGRRGGPQPGSGRPRIHAERMEAKIQFLVTEGQRETIQAAAIAAGESEAGWARRVLLAAAGWTAED